MWCPKEGNLSIRPSIEVFGDASGSRGSGQPRTPPLSIIPRVVVEEVVVLEFEKDGIVQGERRGKNCGSRKLGKALTGIRLG